MMRKLPGRGKETFYFRAWTSMRSLPGCVAMRDASDRFPAVVPGRKFSE